MLLLLSLGLLLHSALTVHRHGADVPLAVILPRTNTEYPWAWPRVGPALERAVRTVNSNPALLRGRHLTYAFESSEDGGGRCSESVAPLMAVDLKLAVEPWAFVGPGCSYASSPVGLFTTHWDIPMVTAGAPAVAFVGGDYPSITNTGPTHRKLGRFATAICRHFGWSRHVVLMYSDNKQDDRPCYFAVEGLYTELKNSSVTLVDRVFEENKAINYSHILEDIQGDGRGECFPTFRHADLPHHQFVFFYIDVFAQSLSTNHRPWERGDVDDAVAQEAFQVPQYTSINVIIRPRPPPLAADDVTLRASCCHGNDDYTTLTHTYTLTCVSSGVTGLVELDENGDRETDFALWDVTENSSSFRVSHRLPSGGHFWASVFWVGGASPPDVPPCGFKNDNPACLQRQYDIISVTSHDTTDSSPFCFYRNHQLEKELVAQLWRISWDDIHMNNTEKHMRSNSRITLSLRGSNFGSLISADGNLQVFAKTGYYKGNIVAIKYSNRKRIELSRKVLFELKHMRDVQNEHLTRFIGACIDAPNICIITEYCPRGSLQDILENDSITLDWMFKYSLINDIVKGMLFLHHSVISSHGKLKSSNCVVDKRFVLKITDFGLSSFRTDRHTGNDAYAFYAQKLWSAPELLRLEAPPPQGTQKGDVYSFSIIVQEVALRRGTFYLEGEPLSPKEVVDKLVLGEWPCLRPSLDTTNHSPELGQLMQRCWAEEPTERPDFTHIRVQLHKQNKEWRTNILDNLLSRMEQYANNLEELVEERTQAYHEEKRKAENLLYQILPHSVAEQLKRGQTVQAEAFDSVTIYFSDIVGFTSISAESTPMEVVTLLNDLYTCFDAIIDNFDVYKVETIGDAYMVVSGLPVRNGNLHGREIARMALALLHAVTTFHIRHRAGEQLKLRIGIHSGPVCAGVVGLKMPRYCLFGDTVNTSSRMESSGEVSFKKMITDHLTTKFFWYYLIQIDRKSKGSIFRT
uniref:Guanylate cyclase n=1 Tax=Gouania willdenowi TaxID=441366 RepID=A0A8C5GCZ2_GOUWI